MTGGESAPERLRRLRSEGGSSLWSLPEGVDSSLSRYVASSPEGRRLCNSPELLGFAFTRQLRTAVGKALEDLQERPEDLAAKLTRLEIADPFRRVRRQLELEECAQEGGDGRYSARQRLGHQAAERVPCVRPCCPARQSGEATDQPAHRCVRTRHLVGQ